MKYIFGIIVILSMIGATAMVMQSGGTNIMVMTICVVDLWVNINLYLVWRFFGGK